MDRWSPELSRTPQNNNLNPECTESTQGPGTSTDRCCLSFSGKATQRSRGGAGVCPAGPPLHQTTLRDQHRATLLLMLYNNQNENHQHASGRVHPKYPRRPRRVKRAFRLGNCPLHSLPPLPALLHYRSSSSKVSKHCNINSSSSMGRSDSCNTQGWKRIDIFLRIPGPERQPDRG